VYYLWERPSKASSRVQQQGTRPASCRVHARCCCAHRGHQVVHAGAVVGARISPCLCPLCELHLPSALAALNTLMHTLLSRHHDVNSVRPVSGLGVFPFLFWPRGISIPFLAKGYCHSFSHASPLNSTPGPCSAPVRLARGPSGGVRSSRCSKNQWGGKRARREWASAHWQLQLVRRPRVPPPWKLPWGSWQVHLGGVTPRRACLRWVWVGGTHKHMLRWLTGRLPQSGPVSPPFAACAACCRCTDLQGKPHFNDHAGPKAACGWDVEVSCSTARWSF
jgi:hypothetical protein